MCVLYVKGWLRWVGRGGGAGGEAADLGAMFSQRCRCFGRQMAPNRNSLSAARSTRQKNRRRDDVRFPDRPTDAVFRGLILPTLARWRWRPNQNTLLRTVTHLETRSQRPLQRCRTLQIHFLVFLFQFFSPPQKKICIKVDSFPWNSIFFHKIKIRTAETIFISNRNV